MTSLRTRLTLSTALAGALVFVVAATFVYAAAQRALWAEFDRTLDAEMQSLAADVEQKGSELEFEIDELMLEKFSRRDAPVYFQAWRQDDGGVVVRSPSLRDVDLPRVQGRVGQTTHRFLELPDGRRGRMAAITFRPPNSLDPEDLDDSAAVSPPLIATLAMAAGTESVERALRQVSWWLAGASTAGVAALVLLQIAVVRRGLHPIARLEGDIEALDAHNLAARVGNESLPQELVPVAGKLNDLLHRLESAFRREQSFTADAAHELRTPLSGIRAQLDVALNRDRTAPEYKNVLNDCRTICGDMQGMIESLLAVARLDAGGASLHRQVTPLKPILRDCWTRYAAAADARRIAVLWDVDDRADAFVDPQHLRVIANNLFENAVAYCNAGGSMAVLAHAAETRARIVVENSGSRLADADRERVLQRFWRADPARADANGHAGLGLTIVEKLVALNGGTVDVVANEGGRFAIAVELPDSDILAPP